MTAVHGPSQLVCFVEICIVTHTSDRNKGSRAQYLHCRCHVWRPCWMWLCRRIFVLMDSTCFPNMRATTTFHVMMLKGLNDIHPPCHFESLFSLNPSLWIPMCFLILMLTCSIPKQFWPSRLIFAPCIFVNNAVIFFNRFFPIIHSRMCESGWDVSFGKTTWGTVICIPFVNSDLRQLVARDPRHSNSAVLTLPVLRHRQCGGRRKCLDPGSRSAWMSIGFGCDHRMGRSCHHWTYSFLVLFHPCSRKLEIPANFLLWKYWHYSGPFGAAIPLSLDVPGVLFRKFDFSNVEAALASSPSSSSPSPPWSSSWQFGPATQPTMLFSFTSQICYLKFEFYTITFIVCVLHLFVLNCCLQHFFDSGNQNHGIQRVIRHHLRA